MFRQLHCLVYSGHLIIVEFTSLALFFLKIICQRVYKQGGSRQMEKQAPCLSKKPDVGLDPRTLGS